MSGKYGTIGAKDKLSLVRKDYNLPLFGVNSVMFRSLVIHYNNGSRWVCSNINPKNAKFLFKVKAKFNEPDFSGSFIVVSVYKNTFNLFQKFEQKHKFSILFRERLIWARGERDQGFNKVPRILS